LEISTASRAPLDLQQSTTNRVHPARSEAEQASFFARWGDDIQSVIATGFQRVERTLDWLLFLQEANDVLGSLTLIFELDRTYAASEIGHFRAFCSLGLVEERHGISGMFFGVSDEHGIADSGTPECSMAYVEGRGRRNGCLHESEKRRKAAAPTVPESGIRLDRRAQWE
jgi:hypothetical protein